MKALRRMSAVLTIGLLLQAETAGASSCIYDKDCPGGYVCDVASGACVVSGYQSSTPSSSSSSQGGSNGTAVAVGLGLAVVLIVVGLVLLNQQSNDTPQFRETGPSPAPPPTDGVVLFSF